MRTIQPIAKYSSEETRSRAAEFYLNGTCLVRAVFNRKFRKIPFFFRHLWCALAE